MASCRHQACHGGGVMQTTTYQKESAICEGTQTADKDTGTQQTEATSTAIVAQHRPSGKEFSTLQAQFARRGHELKSKQHLAGLTLFEVTRHGQTRVFSHWHDVIAFLAQVQQGGQHG